MKTSWIIAPTAPPPHLRMCACGLISARTGFQLCCFCYHFCRLLFLFFCYCFWLTIATNVTMTKRLASGLRLPSEGLQSIISRTKIRYESALARKSKSNQKKRKLPALWTQVCEGLLRNGLVHMCLQHMSDDVLLRLAQPCDAKTKGMCESLPDQKKVWFCPYSKYFRIRPTSD